jgi:hypothetical protein
MATCYSDAVHVRTDRDDEDSRHRDIDQHGFDLPVL